MRGGLGGRIRERRTKLGLTQAELGAPVYQAGYISNVEHGRTTPSLEALGHLASRLGLHPSELLGNQTPALAPDDALAHAAELVAQASAAARAEDQRVLAAAAVVIDALRRQLSR